MARNKYSTQISRFDGKNVFFEVLSNSFPIGKVQMNFIEYDDKTNKQKHKLELYMDIGKALVLCNDILTGRLSNVVANAKKEGKYEGKALTDYTSFFVDMGGINEERVNARFDDLVKQFEWVEKGKALSRQFKIQAGKRIAWIFRAEYGFGETNDTGLIVPKGNAKTFVNIPLTDESLKEFALVLRMHIECYYNQYYSKFGEDLFPNQKVNVFKPDAK